MAKLDCKGCGKSISAGRSKFCSKPCKAKYVERVTAEERRDKSTDIPIRLNAKTVIYVKDKNLVAAAIEKYNRLLAGGLQVQQRGIALTGYKNRGLNTSS